MSEAAKRMADLPRPITESTIQETTMNTSTQVSRILAATIFAALTCSIATVSFASDSSDALQVKVKYGDLNVSSTSGAAALYNRIRVAADTVCHPFQPLNPGDLGARTIFAACVQKAMSNAIKEVNEPALFTIANAKTGTSKPILLASGQAR
jgi:UrcA family protein